MPAPDTQDTFHDLTLQMAVPMFLSTGKEQYESLTLGPIIPTLDRQTLMVAFKVQDPQPCLSTVWPWPGLVIPSVVAMQ
jgi:hypothetical protein